jgi:aspartate racemase
MTRILGIVGGTGPESTIDYYRSIIAGWQQRTADGSYPRLIIRRGARLPPTRHLRNPVRHGSSDYPERFAPSGMTVVAPQPHERDYIHERYFGELVRGLFRDETRQGLVEIIDRMRDRDAIDGLILGGTELALALTEPAYANVPILDTAKVHAEAAVDWLLADEEPAPPPTGQ